MPTTLLILAAGMGSRYGGMKQLDQVGPAGETIMDYSVYDALTAGFDKIVFVIRRSFEQQFKQTFLSKLEHRVEVQLAFQEIDNLPAGFDFNREREKPWGTAHAIWTARELIYEPFAMINADDFYGREAFAAMADFLRMKAPKHSALYAMIGYELANTLSEHGTVSRGVCKTREDLLLSIEEHTRISRKKNGEITDTGGKVERSLSHNTLVSMNFWGFTPSVFDHLDQKLHQFLFHYAFDSKQEIYIPFVIDELIKEDKGIVKIIPTPAHWFGVTYREDKEPVMQRLSEYRKMKVYPDKLF